MPVTPAFLVDKEGRGGVNFTPSCISGTAIGRDLKFYSHDNWGNSRSHTEFQVNPMAQTPLRRTDIRKISSFTLFHANSSQFGCTWNFLTKPVAFES